MKKFTFLLSLLLALTGVTASAQDTFVASGAPSNSDWAANTHWYIMKLDNKFVTIENLDDKDQIKLTDDNTLTSTNISSGADLWCIVGDATTGYKFYNQKAGINKVFGMTNDVSDTGGAARSKMYASTTTHSTETSGTGILFDIKTKNNVNNVYYVSLKNATDNRYWNHRGNYVSYWTNGDAYGNSGSTVRFYSPDTYWDSYWNFSYYEEIKTTAESNKGTAAFTYPEAAVSTYSQAISDAKKVTENITIAQAIEKKNTLGTARWTLLKAINGPKTDGTIYKIQCISTNKIIHANSTWNTNQVLPLNTTTDRSIGWIIEKGTTAGTYKFKSADNGMYIKRDGNNFQTATSDDATDFIIAGATGKSNVVIGTGNNLSNFDWFHGNAVNLIKWEANNVPNSTWAFTEINEDDFAALEDVRTSSLTLMPGVNTNETSIKAALDTYNNTVKFKNAESWNSVVTAVNNALNGKFYRINNKRSDVNLLATDGSNKPKMYPTANGKKLVSSLWKFKLGNGGRFSLSNVNNPEKYVATLTNADGNNNVGKTANDFTDETNAVQFTISKFDNEWLTIRDQNSNILNGENTGNFPINYWNNGINSDGAKWQINEVSTFEVDLKTVEGKSYATAYLPFAVSAVSGAKAYVGTLNDDNTALNMTLATSVPAEKGFVLVGAANATATLTIGTTANDLNTALTGTLVNKAIADEQANYLVFGKNNADNTKVGFFKPTVETIPANKAYLDATGVAGAIAMNFGGNTTGVNTVVLGENGVNAPVFDLSGRRVVAPVKGGVYIQNGKKFIK